MFTTLHLFLIWRIFVHHSNIVYNTHKTLGRLRAPAEPEPFKVHSSRYGVIPIFNS